MDAWSNASPVSRTRTAEFMAAVYRWMAFGLALTGLTAWATISTPSLLSAFYNVQNGHIVGVSGVFWVLGIAEVGLVFAFSAMFRRVSYPTAVAMFLVYAALSGVTFSVYLLTFTSQSIASTLFITGGAFFGLSLYATVTKKDLSSWRSFLIVGLVGVLIASVVNIFLHSNAMQFVISCAGVVVFAGLTAYDTQKLRAMANEADGKMALFGALALYLDFINLFIFLLQLLGRRRD